jgi:LysM repeat protein
VFVTQVKHLFGQRLFDWGLTNEQLFDIISNSRSQNMRSSSPRDLTERNPRMSIAVGSIRDQTVYRRRRVGAAAFVITFLVSVGSMAQSGLADRGGDPASVSAVGQRAAYVVRSGDTLWAIAERNYPGADIALVVDALVSLNGGSGIDVGQILNMP